MNLKEVLIKEADERGISHKSLAKKIGISEQSFCGIVKGRIIPGPLLIKKIARYFKTDTRKIKAMTNEDNEQV